MVSAIRLIFSAKMEKIVIQCTGIRIGKFYIPPFTLNEGELLGVFLYGGAHYFTLEAELISIFNGQKAHPNVHIYDHMLFAKEPTENRFKSRFFPISIEKYLQKHASPNSRIQYRIYEIDDYIIPQRKVINLAGTPRKLLSLFTTFSKSNKIIFNGAGIDPLGLEKVLKIVNEFVNLGATALLFDYFDDSEPYCTKYIRLEVKEY